MQNSNVLEVNASKAPQKKDPELKIAETKEPERKFAWTQNVKYRGKRYRANRPANILPGDIESLLEAKVIKVVN